MGWGLGWKCRLAGYAKWKCQGRHAARVVSKLIGGSLASLVAEMVRAEIISAPSAAVSLPVLHL